MKGLKKLSCFLLLSLLSVIIHAQGEKNVQMADSMRSNGRIYVVVAVVLTILAGLILYVVRLEKKMNKLEKEN